MNQLLLYEHQDLERVQSAIGGQVLSFIRSIGVGQQFYAMDLCQWVWCDVTCAPESPGRVMRQLRLKGYFDYDVVNRRQALYKITRISNDT